MRYSGLFRPPKPSSLRRFYTATDHIISLIGKVKGVFDMGQFDATYTLKDAMERYCPQTFGALYGSGKCMGDACMAWRWTRSSRPVYGSELEGYCGLAGNPTPFST